MRERRNRMADGGVHVPIGCPVSSLTNRMCHYAPSFHLAPTQRIIQLQKLENERLGSKGGLLLELHEKNEAEDIVSKQYWLLYMQSALATASKALHLGFKNSCVNN